MVWRSWSAVLVHVKEAWVVKQMSLLSLHVDLGATIDELGR